MSSALLRLRITVSSTLVLLLFLLALAGGCGHGHGHAPVVLRGTLEVFNLPSSHAAVDGVETRLVGSRLGDFRDVRATPGAGVFLDLPAAHYDVSVFWDTGDRDTFLDVPVRYAATTTLDVRY